MASQFSSAAHAWAQPVNTAFSCRGFLLLLGVMAGNCSGFPGPGFRSHCQTLGSSGSTVETEWNWPLKVLWHSVSVLCSLLKLSANPNLWHSVALFVCFLIFNNLPTCLTLLSIWKAGQWEKSFSPSVSVTLHPEGLASQCYTKKTLPKRIFQSIKFSVICYFVEELSRL